MDEKYINDNGDNSGGERSRFKDRLNNFVKQKKARKIHLNKDDGWIINVLREKYNR